jgi:two-component system sensor histidine kinase DegS
VAPTFGRNLDDIANDVLLAIQSLDTRLATLVDAVERVRNELDTSRATVQRDREELDLEYSLEIGSQYVVESPHSRPLREAEKTLTQEAIRAAAFHRQLVEFSSLISASARRFTSESELPGTDAATEAAIRSAAVEAQENERHRLAREVHDGPAQALANAVIALEFVERAIRSGGDAASSRSLEEVDRIKSTLREGLTEIRRFIFDLRPTMLQDRGLSATVEHYIATYQSLFPMAIDFEAQANIPRLSNDQELTAFRVIQESIQNARKHARATRVTVNVAQQVDHLVVAIVDNGRGFSPERVTTHMLGGVGLRGMQERAALVGGEIEIESAPGEGTKIELRIPLAPAPPAAAAASGPAPVARKRSGENSVAHHEVEQSSISRPA